MASTIEAIKLWEDAMSSEVIPSPVPTARSESEAPRPVPPANARRRSIVRRLSSGAAIVLVVGFAQVGVHEPTLARATMIAGTCLVLWLTEAIPLFATTLLFWAAVVLLLGPLDPKSFSLPRVLSAAKSPVLLLCFGGFVLSASGAKYGIGAYVAQWVIRAAGGRRRLLLLAVMTVDRRGAARGKWQAGSAARCSPT